MQPILLAGHKRVQQDFDAERPAKAAQLLWKSSHQSPVCSPALNCHMTTRRHACPFMSDTTVPELSLPVYQALSDEENDPDLPIRSFRHVSSVWESSPRYTLHPQHAHLARSGQHEHGADLLVHLAKSPPPDRVVGGSHHACPPSTPSTQHAVLPTVTPSQGMPDQHFNFADFVNVTPSPAQPAWGSLTLGDTGRTSLSTKDALTRLNFDAFVSLSTSSPRLRAKETRLALQLGGEPRP
jgi:hypothetical protein